ncbi:MAG: hypothetical protein AB7C97_07520 [Oscillospiraceae bacterium]
MKRPRKLILLPVAILLVITLAVILTYDYTKAPAPEGSGTETATASSGDDGSDTTGSGTATTGTTGNSGGAIASGIVTANLSDDGSVYYAVTFDSETAECAKAESDMIFTSKTDADAFIEFRYMKDRLPEDVEPSFADDYLNYQNIEFDGLDSVGATELFGRYILATNSNEKLECYLVSLDNGTLAVAVKTGSDTPSEAENTLAEILDSLTVSN